MKNLKLYIIIGIIFVSIIGTLLHFLYLWSGENPIIGIFSAINESTWEHMKLVFFPFIIYSAYINKTSNKAYLCLEPAMSFGTLLGTFLIPILFYTYSGVLGFNVAIIDISIFFISVILAFYAVYKLGSSCKLTPYKNFLNLMVVIMLILFVIFTFFPPELGLFTSPV